MKKLLPILLLIIVTISCERNEPKHLYTDLYGKEWGQFKLGTYWIFRNDSTLQIIDTIKVINYGTNNYSRTDSLSGKDFISEKLQTYIGIEYTNESVVSIFYDGMIYVDGMKEIGLLEDYFDLQMRVRDVVFRYSDEGIIQETIETDKFLRKIEFIEEYTVNGKVYKDVVYIKSISKVPDEVFYNPNPRTHLNTFEYWIAKNNWIIKKVLVDSDKTYTWSLVDSKIIQ